MVRVKRSRYAGSSGGFVVLADAEDDNYVRYRSGMHGSGRSREGGVFRPAGAAVYATGRSRDLNQHARRQSGRA